jgi:hypothetical protein
MATGYLLGTGHDPYVGQDLIGVFHHISFDVTTAVGYPPPWPLVLGFVYRATYAVVLNLLVYNLAIKIPVIAANIGLAYLAGGILRNLGASSAASRRAWVFLLLNPLLLYFGAAWGQIDSIVALLALVALALLFAQRLQRSAILLALAFTFKPIALPLLPVALVYVARDSSRKAVRYAAVLLGAVLLFYVVPFLVLGWSLAPFSQHLNAHFTLRGTMSYMMVVRVFRDPLMMQGRWWLLGLVWMGALALGILAWRRGDGGFVDLLKMSTGLTLVFFLTRTWLAEPNVILVLPMVLILASLGALDRRALTAVWVLPLAFTLFNSSPLQLLWVAFPGAWQRSLETIASSGDTRLVARAVLAVAWQVAGWWIVVTCFRKSHVRSQASASKAPAP